MFFLNYKIDNFISKLIDMENTKDFSNLYVVGPLDNAQLKAKLNNLYTYYRKEIEKIHMENDFHFRYSVNFSLKINGKDKINGRIKIYEYERKRIMDNLVRHEYGDQRDDIIATEGSYSNIIEVIKYNNNIYIKGSSTTPTYVI